MSAKTSIVVSPATAVAFVVLSEGIACFAGYLDQTYVIAAIHFQVALLVLWLKIPSKGPLKPQQVELPPHPDKTASVESAHFLGDSLEIDERDQKTPDAWVRRHPELVRLTGRHPFNCEPPLPKLKEGGFITPPTLHYVRNHGAVPVKAANAAERQQVWDDWRIKIHGLVDTPLVITLDQLMALPQRQIPVLLVCAGNRRKEQNMIRKTVGFNWGASGLACNVWTGVRLCDLLKLAGVHTRDQGATHVCFNGPKKELPGGKDGVYGTSVTLETAMDPAQDVMIAFKQNGQFLEPDHGFPVRLIIPGYIGGRMIKWLKEIVVTPKQSDNFYHFMDNQVMPPGVTPESAEKEGWWYKGDYIINQLNTNSAMWSPAHDELKLLDYADAGAMTQGLPSGTYELSGYAYTGNGTKVHRVEVSFDNGMTWERATMNHPEKPTEYGKYWCWCFWSFQASTAQLTNCGEVVCRAWDGCQNTQPKDLTWNVMGMMNNPWFRIKVHKIMSEGKVIGIKFEHPTLAGTQQGGWMTRPEKEAGWARTPTGAVLGLHQAPYNGSDVPTIAPMPVASVARPLVAVAGLAAPTAAKAAAAVAAPAGMRKITMEEVAKHTEEKDSWFVVNGNVYDSSAYNQDHPGGADSILMVAGEDATVDFEAIHSKKAWKLLEKYQIGVVGDANEAAAAATPPPPTATKAAESTELVALNLRKKLTVPLLETKVVGNDGTNDVIFMKLGLPSPEHRLGLPTGKHFMVYANCSVFKEVTDEATGQQIRCPSGEKEMKIVARAYTPISNDSQKGSVDMVIKVYSAPGKEGKMSSHFGNMKVGDTLELKGPIGHVHYTRNQFELHGNHTVAVTHVGMIAGGTGITPMYQVIQTALADPDDTTVFHLIYANQLNAGICLQDELDAIQKAHPGRLTIEYVVSKLDPKLEDSHRYSVGYITEAIIDKHICTVAGGQSKVEICCLCGPPGMIKFACLPNLTKLGFKEDQQIQF